MMDNLKKDKRLYLIIVLTIIVIAAFILFVFQSTNVTESFDIAVFAWLVETSIILDLYYIDTKKKKQKFLEELDRELEDDLKK